MPINYNKAYIYKLWSLQTEDIYIGSSTTDKRLRLSLHKSHYRQFLKGKKKYCLTSSNIVKYPDCKIEIIEKFPCNNRAELEKREGEIQRATDCCNKNIAGRSNKEYYIDNREKYKEYYKEYYDDNKEKFKEYYNDNREKKLKNQKIYDDIPINKERKKIRDQKRHKRNLLKKKQNKILEELYDVLSGKDDEPLIDAINDIQSIIC